MIPGGRIASCFDKTCNVEKPQASCYFNVEEKNDLPEQLMRRIKAFVVDVVLNV